MPGISTVFLILRRFSILFAILIAIGTAVYIVTSQSGPGGGREATTEDVPAAVLPEEQPKKTAVATQDIYPKVTNPEKRFFPVYSEFEETTGSLPGEIALLAPCGAEIPSLYEGIVAEIGPAGHWNGGYGNFIRLDLSGSERVVYAHLDKIFAREGDFVNKGELLGTAGRSGSLPEDAICLFGIIGENL